MVLAHGSGLDELAIFMFPVVMGLGFWLLSRQRLTKRAEEAEDEEVPVTRIASEPPNAPRPKPVNGAISPFHSLIPPPVPSTDDEPAADSAPTATTTSP